MRVLLSLILPGFLLLVAFSWTHRRDQQQSAISFGKDTIRSLLRASNFSPLRERPQPPQPPQSEAEEEPPQPEAEEEPVVEEPVVEFWFSPASNIYTATTPPRSVTETYTHPYPQTYTPLSNEFAQLRRFWRLAGEAVDERGEVYIDRQAQAETETQAQPEVQVVFPGRKGPDVVFDDYLFDIVTTRNDTFLLQLSIEEKRKDAQTDTHTHTAGGTSFHIQWEVVEADDGGAMVEKDGSITIPRSVLSYAACGVWDHFNGTYTATCRPPLFIDEGMSRVIIEVYYLDYKAFQTVPLGVPLCKSIYEETWGAHTLLSSWRDLHTYTRTPEQEEEKENSRRMGRKRREENDDSDTSTPASLPVCENITHLSTHGEWANIDGALRFVLPQPHANADTHTDRHLQDLQTDQAPPSRRPMCVAPTFLSSFSEVKSCLSSSFDSIMLIGDSHLRRFSEFVAAFTCMSPILNEGEQEPTSVTEWKNESCVEQMEWGHFDTFFFRREEGITQGEGNEAGGVIDAQMPGQEGVDMRFLWNMKGAELAKRMREDVNDGKMKTSRDVLIMDTSHWDLIDNDITSFVCLGLSPVIAAMEELRQNPLTENLRIIWVASFPMPPQHDGTFRSVPTAAAADIFLAPHWARLGVEVLEVLPLLRPRVAEVADYHHWTTEYSREGDFKGEVGAEIARMLTGTLCSL